MNTPTPRTDAAWAQTFQDDDDQCRAGNAASDMRDECAKIERELTAERDQLRGALALGQQNCDDAYDELRGDADELRADVVRLTAERDELRADCENETKWAAHYLAESIAVKGERDQLRAVFPQICAAIGNGAFCTPTVSVGFIQSIPNEVQLVVAELRARAERAEAELATERDKVRVLREALENLRDEQNGVPLYTREEQWKQAMDGAEAALAATEAKP